MLNEDLFDPKDLEIAKLKRQIQRFKEYDDERKQYYKESLRKLGELESYVAELEESTEIGKLKEKIKKQQLALRDLNAIILVNKYIQDLSEEEMQVPSLRNKICTLENKVESLEHELKVVREARNSLLNELLKYQKNDDN